VRFAYLRDPPRSAQHTPHPQLLFELPPFYNLELGRDALVT